MLNRRAGAVSLVTLALLGVLATVANLAVALSTRSVPAARAAVSVRRATPVEALCSRVRVLSFAPGGEGLEGLSASAAACGRELAAVARDRRSPDRAAALVLLRYVPGEEAEEILLGAALAGEGVDAALARVSLEARGIVLPGGEALVP